MMTFVFILQNEQAPSLDALTSQLQQVAGARLDIRSVASLEALKLQLRKVLQAIIISNQAPPQLGALMMDCQQELSSTSFISVLENPSAYTDAMWASNSQFVKTTADDFTWAAALSTATLQSALQTKILPPNKMDEVDNLLNRPFFMQRLGEEISASRRHKAPLCCVIFSVNYYRMYLDSYGYQFVNALLGFVGEEINRLIRHEDQVARMGDDELALLIPRCSEADAKKLIQRLAGALNKLGFQFEGYTEEISVCAGLAAYPLVDDTPATPDVLVRYAHHALHQAKTNPEEGHCVSIFSEIRPTL
jgi:diguanylate cyclase (GGDEF)-like protein